MELNISRDTSDFRRFGAEIAGGKPLIHCGKGTARVGSGQALSQD